MDRWAGKVALITGASGGIGRQITRVLAKYGMKVIPVARRLEKLEELASSIKCESNAEVYPIKCDVRREQDIIKVFKWADAELGGVDVLINNAAVLEFETIIEGSTDTFYKMIETNLIGTAICSREFVQSVKKRKASGHIVNINSTAGHCAQEIHFPISMYCASKYGITGMTHTLRNELSAAKLDIKVTSISPGAVDTDMIVNIHLTNKNTFALLKAEDIASAVVYTLSVPSHVEINELIIKAHQNSQP